jgi:hypothetical protein
VALVRTDILTANVVPSSPIPVTLMMVAQSSSETSILTRVKRCNISKDDILHSSWFSLVPEQMLSWYPNSTLLCMLHMQPSQW